MVTVHDRHGPILSHSKPVLELSALPPFQPEGCTARAPRIGPRLLRTSPVSANKSPTYQRFRTVEETEGWIDRDVLCLICS